MSRQLIPITRRRFVRLALVGTVSTLLEAACQSPYSPIPTTATPALSSEAAATLKHAATYALAPSPTSKTTASATPKTGPTLVASPAPELVATFPRLSQDTPEILRSRSDPYFNVRYYRPFPPVDHNVWRLKVSGLIEARVSFGLSDLLGWPQVAQISRMKCVECWSFKAKWEGFTYATLAERVRPGPEATHVRFDCADDYWEIVSIEKLADPRVIFVLRMNDAPLLDEYGAPLRIMFPAKYGYKSAKAITSITFADRGGAGYWSTVGPYTGHGDIQPGFDLPQDLPKQRMQIDGGEITAY